MKLAIFLLVNIMLLKDHYSQLQLIFYVIAKHQEIYGEYDKKDGQKSPVTQSNKIEEDENFLNNMKISQQNNNANYVKDFDT